MTTGRRQRFNIEVSTDTGGQPMHVNVFNNSPVRPGKVDKVFNEAIEDVMAHITRNGKHESRRWHIADDIFIGRSDNIVVMVRKVEV